jgi:putative ABC transport system ATP-binding protein
MYSKELIMALVTLENVSRTYQMGETQVQALADVNLNIEPSAFAALVGPSGSGKTTALNLIGCLDKPTKGKVVVAGQNINELHRKNGAAFRGHKLGFVFQDFNLLPVLTVAENVEYPLLMIRDTPKNQRMPAVIKALEAVAMGDQAEKYPAQLSGGQKQRVAIARALVGKPDLVLADEPTANLDGASAHRVIDLMKKMRDDFGTTFIFSTHDQRIMDQAEVLFHLEDGRLLDSADGVKEAGHA